MRKNSERGEFSTVRGLQFIVLDDGQTRKALGSFDDELVPPVQAIRWIALGKIISSDALPRSWRSCAPEQLAAEKTDQQTRMLYAELALLKQISMGKIRCAIVEPSADNGLGEQLMLSILSPAEFEGAKVEREWRDDGLTLMIKRERDDSHSELSGFLLFWSEINAFRTEYLRENVLEKNWDEEERRALRALTDARESLANASSRASGRVGPGRPPGRLYAPAVLSFARHLEALGYDAAMTEKVDVLAMNLAAEFVKQGQRKPHERTIRDEATAIRNIVFGSRPKL